MKITFCGASERVTGSNYLVDTGNIKFLVDCGLFQGSIEADKQNWDDFLYDPKQIKFVLITHSHIDHIGRLPLLYKRGFRGKIYATRPTAEFCRIFLEDNCKIFSEMASGIGMEKLYEQTDVDSTMKLFESYDYYQKFEPEKGIEIKFYDAGHILGSTIIEIKANKKTLVFSGDLGNPPVPILKDTDFIDKSDYVVMESTYGDRNHEPFEERELRLERIIEETVKDNGVLLIPAFAMERTQEIIFELNNLIKHGRINKIPIYLDSPLAMKATEIYKKYSDYFDDEAKKLIESGHDFFQFPELKFIKSVEESKEIDHTTGSKIIIAGSGMSTGGKILFHEKRYLSEPTTRLLIIGYQVKGTLGRNLQDGAKNINILGENIQVNAKIEIIDSYSAHADQDRLLYWVSKFTKSIKKIFIVHGEQIAENAILHQIEAKEGISVYIPKFGETVEL
jgi:metallo-beta-lactamase family protein